MVAARGRPEAVTLVHLWPFLLVLSVLAGCGRDEFPLTPLRLAIISESELGAPQAAVRDGLNPLRVEDVGDDGVGVRLRYADGTRLTVVLLDSLGQGVATCTTQVRERCVVTPTGTLLWSRRLEGEGPGSVAVVHQRGSHFVVVDQQGPVITGDPRRQELSVSVEKMLALAADERIAARTTQPEEPRDYFDASRPPPPPL